MFRASSLLSLLALSLCGSAPAQADPLRTHGCVACHTTDGSVGPGPTFRGAWGAARTVTTDGVTHPVTFDRAYLERSLATPNADVLEGYPPGLMPAFDLPAEQIDAIAAGLEALAPPAEPPPVGPLWPMWAGALLFVFGHLLLSSGPVRPALVARLGERSFQGLYSLLTGAAFVWMVVAWSDAPYVHLWDAHPWTRWLPFLAMPVVMVGLVLGYTTPSPTAVGGEAALERPPRGVLAITRHPANLATVAWALVHVPPNGDLAALIFFGSIALLGLLGTWHIERRRLRTHGEAWRAFAARTSIIPFLAIAQGRARLHLAQLGLARIVGAVILWFVFLALHGWMFGASPLP